MNEQEQAAMNLGQAVGEAVAVGVPKETIKTIVDGGIALCSLLEAFGI